MGVGWLYLLDENSSLWWINTQSIPCTGGKITLDLVWHYYEDILSGALHGPYDFIDTKLQIKIILLNMTTTRSLHRIHFNNSTHQHVFTNNLDPIFCHVCLYTHINLFKLFKLFFISFLYCYLHKVNILHDKLWFNTNI